MIVWSPAIRETRRPIATTIATTMTGETPERGNVRPTCDGAGRTFVQDGFDARTGDEREPREQPGRTESEASTRSENERANRREIVRRPSNWRKGERGRPNGASLSSPGFEIRISPTIRKFAVSLEVLKLRFLRQQREKERERTGLVSALAAREIATRICINREL